MEGEGEVLPEEGVGTEGGGGDRLVGTADTRPAAPSLACLFVDEVQCGCKFALRIAGVVMVENGEFVCGGREVKKGGVSTGCACLWVTATATYTCAQDVKISS